MRAVIAAGGTGGHINPALAIADELKKRHKAEILFIGCADRLESTLVPKAGYNIKYIKAAGYNRANILSNIKTVFVTMNAISRAKKILREFRPDVVVGTGGYISAPTVMAAQKLGIKTVLHEQNAFIGMSTRMLAKKAKIVFLSFDKNANAVETGGKVIVSGNPVRELFNKKDKFVSKVELGMDDAPLVYSSGGSQGAESINNAVIEMLPLIKDEKLNLIHSTGKRFYSDVMDKIKAKGYTVPPNVQIKEYVYNVPGVLSAADLIIGRSGAITLAETSVLGVASILIPSPNVTDNHQHFNAMSFVQEGAAVVIEEEKLNGESLYENVMSIIRNEKVRKKMSEAALRISKPEALKIIADEIDKIL